MADITLPSGIEITAMPLEIEYPGKIEHRSPFTGRATYLYRSPGRWFGTVTLALTDHVDEQTGAQAQAFVAGLRGGGRSADLPFPGPSVASTTSTTVLSVAADGRLNLFQPIQAQDGDHINIRGRLFVIRSTNTQAGSTSMLTVEPTGVARAGDALGPATVITVQRRGQISPTPRDAEFWGPWTFQIEEVVA